MTPFIITNMERFITVLNPQSQMHADLACDTLEAMDIYVVLSYVDTPEGGQLLRLMVPERFEARALLALQNLDCSDISSRPERGARFSIKSAA